MKILKITDGKPGHITVSDGVIDAISQNYAVEVTELHIKLRVKFLLRVLKFIINNDWLRRNTMTYDWLLGVFYKNYQRPNRPVDLIISTGGDTSFINVWLAKALDAKNIYCSNLRGIKPELFYLLISTLESNLENSIQLEIAPTKIGLKNILPDINHFCDKNGIDKKKKYFVLLIGGNGAGYRYTKKDFTNLVKNFMNLVLKNDAKALITTSRRTGMENEKFLHEQFSKYNKYIAYSVYFNEKPEKVVAAYLNLATKIFVTEESGSMITESLFYKKPVFTLRPKNVKDQKRYELFLDDLYTKKRIICFSLEEDFSNIDLQIFDFSYMQKTPIDDLAKKIQPYIKEFIS
jgi:mitochondrial fission protein ELM1